MFFHFDERNLHMCPKAAVLLEVCGNGAEGRWAKKNGTRTGPVSSQAPRRARRGYSSTRTTTRRFCARPSRVELSAAGFDSPKEIVVIA